MVRANAVNEAIVEAGRADGRIFLWSTMLDLDGRVHAAHGALSFRPHRRTIDLALEILAEQLARVTT